MRMIPFLNVPAGVTELFPDRDMGIKRFKSGSFLRTKGAAPFFGPVRASSRKIDRKLVYLFAVFNF